MRIVAGDAKGRKIKVPSGRLVRPTTDRVREAIFSSLGDRVPGSSVLDLFAGSGAMGIEALSRGASKAVFVEQSSTVGRVLLSNIETVGVRNRSKFIRGNALGAIRSLSAQNESFDLIFLDPPYGKDLLKNSLKIIVETQILSPGGRIVAERERAGEINLPQCKSLLLAATKVYGETQILMLDLIEYKMHL